MATEKERRPMTESEKEAPKKLRMGAYYFGFYETGVRSIDEILSAVACAGKGYHHTESWGDKAFDGGPSYVELIQDAANRAAKQLEQARAEGYRAGRDEAATALDDAYDGGYADGFANGIAKAKRVVAEAPENSYTTDCNHAALADEIGALKPGGKP